MAKAEEESREISETQIIELFTRRAFTLQTASIIVIND